jgi:hypothetical protein
MAKSAALALRVSKMVSTRSASTPPSSSAFTCCEYAVTTWSHDTARKSGRFTSGDNDKVRLSGPMAPATKQRRPGVFASAFSTARFAHATAARFRSVTMCSSL